MFLPPAYPCSFPFSMKRAFPALASILLLCTQAFSAPAEKKPNILYILADDLGYEDTGFMGSKRILTPELDKLAKDGTVLTSFYVQPLCSPTRAALMTGRYPSHTGMYTVVGPGAGWGLGLGERTLAEALGEAGYETAIVGKWHLGATGLYRPTQRGFDHQYGCLEGLIDYYKHEWHGPDWYRDDKPIQEEGYSTHLIAKEACRLIREHSTDKPLFLYLAFNAPHSPYQVPDSYLKPFADLPEQRRLYAGMVAAMDEAVGQVIATLKEKGILDNTVVIFSSDNGATRYGGTKADQWAKNPETAWPGSNAPLRMYKNTIFEGGVRGCAFVSWPGHVPAGKRLDEPLHVIDWYPTLVKLAGGSLEQKLPLDGQDIWPVLTEGAKSPHEMVLLCGSDAKSASLRVGDWKLLHGEKGDQLYNLAADIGETNDLAATHPEKVKELRGRLDSLMKDAVPPAGGAGKEGGE